MPPERQSVAHPPRSPPPSPRTRWTSRKPRSVSRSRPPVPDGCARRRDHRTRVPHPPVRRAPSPREGHRATAMPRPPRPAARSSPPVPSSTRSMLPPVRRVGLSDDSSPTAGARPMHPTMGRSAIVPPVGKKQATVRNRKLDDVRSRNAEDVPPPRRDIDRKGPLVEIDGLDFDPDRVADEGIPDGDRPRQCVERSGRDPTVVEIIGAEGAVLRIRQTKSQFVTRLRHADRRRRVAKCKGRRLRRHVDPRTLHAPPRVSVDVPATAIPLVSSQVLLGCCAWHWKGP